MLRFFLTKIFGKTKKQERVERILRGLLKEPENVRCINCNRLGPQYVCTKFCTFVCKNCSGVHREYSHPVKSVSKAKFNAEEIVSLQTGGNERAKQIYFKTWDPQLDVYPDSSNRYELREFIRHVYIDRMYTGQNSLRDDFLVRHSSEGAGNGMMEEIELRTFEKSSPSMKKDERSLRWDMFEEQRSPRFVPEIMMSANHRNRHIEIVDDRFREDGSVKLYDRYTLGRESRSGSMLPATPRIRGKNLTEIQHVKEISGKKAPVLAIAPPPKANDRKDAERKQVRFSTEIPGSTKSKQKQDQIVNFGSLIDLKTEFQRETVASNSSKESNCSPLSTNKNSIVASNLNSVEDLLFGFSDPGTESPFVDDVGTLIIAVDNNQTLQTNSSDSQALVTQQWNASQTSNDPRIVSSIPGDGSKQGGRTELPADLFTSRVTEFTPPSPGWQMHPSQGLGRYNVQYYSPPMLMPAHPHPGKSNNPFHIGDDSPQVAHFPSVSPLQVDLPRMSAATALQSQPAPYLSPLSPPVPTYGMSMPLVPGGQYMGQQSRNTQFTTAQGIASSQDTFAYLNHIEQSNRPESLPTPSISSTLSRGGNPFG